MIAFALLVLSLLRDASDVVADLFVQTRTLRLHEAAHALPDVDAGVSADIDVQVDAAIAVETRRVPAELLVSIAWGESRFRRDVDTGVVCGPLQVSPRDLDGGSLPHVATCAAWSSDPVEAYAAAVRELEAELDDVRTHGDLRLALLYRACGNAAFAHLGQTPRHSRLRRAVMHCAAKRPWPSWVLARARWLAQYQTQEAARW